jgi:predicted lipid-binding transport protein (Tim44 family)
MNLPHRRLLPRTALLAIATLRRTAVPALRRALPALAALAVVVLVSAVANANARPGGGSSFGSSGGSGRSGGGGGGGGGGDCTWIIELIVFLAQLTIEHPAAGIPLDLVIIGTIVWVLRSTTNAQKRPGWTTGAVATSPAARVVPASPSRVVRKQLFLVAAQADPGFSLVLFEDFAYALYAAVHEARGRNQADALSPYLGIETIGQLFNAASGLNEVRAIVVGALIYVRTVASNASRRIEVTLEFQTNYTEIKSSGDAQAYYVVERWTLSRARAARSRKPETARIIGCPNCGAPLSSIRGNTCSYCKQVVNTGEFDWMVDSIVEIEKTARPPQLTGDTAEVGNDFPTVVDPEAQARYQALTSRDPAMSWQHLTGRVALVFGEMQVAWSTLEWKRARPFVSDQLFQMLSYWMDTYAREKMRNVTENGRITRIELCAVISDVHYDAVTLRIFATSLDYTITEAGKVVSGSRTKERAYTEYWTLIRGSRAKTRAASDRVCPNCGAPLDITMTGNCTSCNAKVTAGEFDWVLSRIEQDDVYG